MKCIGHVRCEKQDATSEAQSGAFYAPQHPISQRVSPGNGIARYHPKLSFGPKEVDWACSLRKNKTQLRKHKVVHCKHPKTRSHKRYLPATESRETTQKLSIGPKEVDWACSLRKNKTQLRKHKAVHCMHPKPVLTTGTSRQRNRAKPPRPKEVDWARS